MARMDFSSYASILGWFSCIPMVAFHGDYTHDVRPVAEGFRFAITHNISSIFLLPLPLLLLQPPLLLLLLPAPDATAAFAALATSAASPAAATSAGWLVKGCSLSHPEMLLILPCMEVIMLKVLATISLENQYKKHTTINEIKLPGQTI